MLFSFTNSPRHDSLSTRELKAPAFDQTLSENALNFIDYRLSSQQKTSYRTFLEWTAELSNFADGIVGTIEAASLPALSLSFSRDFLETKRGVIVQQCPVVPYADIGISAHDVPQGDAVWGLAYSETYFIRREMIAWEPLHFHELVHLTQREILGHSAYVGLHLVGLLFHGYRESPLEKIAYRLQNQFYNARFPVDVQREVYNSLRALIC